MTGKESAYMKPGLKPACKEELLWAWDALSSCTCCKSLSVMVSGACVFQAGLIPDGAKPGKVVDGAISRRAMSTGKANFLANIALFPGEEESFSFQSLLRAVVGR
jgi:Cofactor assembly of complex C subunit B, CCB2/CCB4